MSMDIMLMFCPYCGGELGPKDDTGNVCQSCGKNIFAERQSIDKVIPSGEAGSAFRDALAAVNDDNPKKALEIAEEFNESSPGADALFLRGAVYAYMGEDGKAAIDWKKGLEAMTSFTNIDAYVCIMSRAIADMIYFKEKEFIDFEPVKYIDKLCDEIHADTGESCKAFFFYTVYNDCEIMMEELQDEGVEVFKDIIPLLFRRTVEYHRNMLCLIQVIDAYLAKMGYNPETYEDDDMADLHVYDLISSDLKKYTAGMTAEDMRKIMFSWDDTSLRANESILESLMPSSKDSVIGKLLSRKNSSEEAQSEPDAVDLYVRRLLLLDKPNAEECAPQ